MTEFDARKLWDQIQEEENDEKMQEMISNLDEEQLKLLCDHQKVISPYAFPTFTKDKYVCFSIINMRENNMRNETMVSFSSFMYRMLDEENEISNDEKSTIRKFMDKYLCFNPDTHVKSSYDKKNKKDTTRDDLCVLDKQFIPHVPPSDTFFRWRFYHDANYDAIRKATEILYCDKIDLDAAINIYDRFETQEEAKEFVRKYQKDFKCDVFTSKIGAWSIIAPFKANREKTDIYNKDVEILEDLLKKREEDHKLGEDMLKNRVRKLKKNKKDDINLDELKMYKDTFNDLHKKGVKNLSEEEHRQMMRAKENIELSDLKARLSNLESKGFDNLTPEESKEYKITKDQIEALEESIEIPDNAIQVNVYETAPDGSFNKSKFYTKTETPSETDSRIKKEELTN